jgi:oxygen-independent coproporphyrinogen-3 oxidase
VPLPDDDLAADMYEWAAARLAQAGYQQYEISNWATRRDGELLACRHNLQYWRNQPYLGFGAGAHGYASGVRTANVLGIRAYIERCQAGEPRPFPLGPALADAHEIDRQTAMGETLMVGLRLTEEGVSNQDFSSRFGQDLTAVFPKPIERLGAQGLLEWAGDRLRLTSRGRLLGNRVFREFVG